jgi:hypothetical protein
MVLEYVRYSRLVPRGPNAKTRTYLHVLAVYLYEERKGGKWYIIAGFF